MQYLQVPETGDRWQLFISLLKINYCAWLLVRVFILTKGIAVPPITSKQVHAVIAIMSTTDIPTGLRIGYAYPFSFGHDL